MESNDIRIRKSEFVANSQFLYTNIYELYYYLINLPMHYKVYVVMDRKTNLWDYKLNCEGQYVHFLLSEAPCRARGEGSKEQGGGVHCTVQVIGWKRSTPQLKKITKMLERRYHRSATHFFYVKVTFLLLCHVIF